MIKVALKHFIYEACINVMFDNIIKHFITTERDLYNVKPGDKVRNITMRGYFNNAAAYNDEGDASVHYFSECTITDFSNKYSLSFHGRYRGKFGNYYLKYSHIIHYVI